jgi:hypothetical protein
MQLGAKQGVSILAFQPPSWQKSYRTTSPTDSNTTAGNIKMSGTIVAMIAIQAFFSDFY